MKGLTGVARRSHRRQLILIALMICMIDAVQVRAQVVGGPFWVRLPIDLVQSFLRHPY